MQERKSNVYVQRILEYLLSRESITIDQLANEIGLSEKTTRTKIDAVNDSLRSNHLGIIHKRPRVGVWLEASDEQRQKITAMIKNDYEVTAVFQSRDRLETALKIILKAEKQSAITTQQLALQLYLSVPTTLKVIRECKKWLAMFNIELNIQRSRGIQLTYTEVSYRIVVKHYILQFETDVGIEEAISYFTPGLDLGLVKKAIITAESAWGFKFADESYKEIFIYTTLGVYNKKLESSRSPLLVSDEEKRMLEEYSEYVFAESIYKQISALMDVYISENEIIFLSIQILCSKLIDTNFAQDSGELLRRYDSKLHEFVSKIIKVISNVLNQDLTHDEALFHGLLIHIRPTIFRLRFEKSHPNGMFDYIKKAYNQTFRVSWLISVLFEEYYNLQVTGDEISYITLYIQSAIERNETPMRAILVTQQGMGLNQLIVEKLKQYCPIISDIRVVSSHDFKLDEFKNIEIIFTTDDMGLADERIIQIEAFTSDRSLQEINHKIRVLKHNMRKKETKFDSICHTLFEPDLIFTNLDFTDKESLLEYLCVRLAQKGYVTDKYFMTVMDREHATSTSIGNGVAIPHGDQFQINEGKVVIATLRHPVYWDENDKIDVIFLLAVRMTNEFEIQKTQQFYKQYIKLVETDEDVRFLKSFESSVEFYKYLVQ